MAWMLGKWTHMHLAYHLWRHWLLRTWHYAHSVDFPIPHFKPAGGFQGWRDSAVSDAALLPSLTDDAKLCGKCVEECYGQNYTIKRKQLSKVKTQCQKYGLRVCSRKHLVALCSSCHKYSGFWHLDIACSVLFYTIYLALLLIMMICESLKNCVLIPSSEYKRKVERCSHCI